MLMDKPTREAGRNFARDLPEEEVVEAVRKHPSSTPHGWAITGFAYPPSGPLVFIKHGSDRWYQRDEEARTHQWAFDALQQVPLVDRQGIHIPEVYRIISRNGYTYIIMELVVGETLLDLRDSQAFEEESEKYYAKVETALRLLLSLPVPQDVSPGPCGGGFIKNALFKDYCAPIEYNSTEMLERHLNKIATIRRKEAPTVQLERELRFVFGDLYGGNFIFSNDGEELYIVDFEQAGFMPVSFMSYALIQPTTVGTALRDRLGLPQDNIKAMRHICNFFVMGTRRLGLPLD